MIVILRRVLKYLQIIMQFVNPKTKTITFENFLRGLKWCETSKPEDKLKGIIDQL